MNEQPAFGMERTQTHEELFGVDDATVEAAGLSAGVADAVAECIVRYEEAIAELAAAG